MSARVTLATAKRVLLQLRHDPRTIALLLVVPCVLVTLIKYVFAGSDVFDRIGAPLLGVFPLLSMFLVTSIAMLRERTTGTLERLLTMPVGKLDLLIGYALAFAAIAVAQAALLSVVAFGALDLHVDGVKWGVVLFATANALLGMSLGLFVSAFARTEFQAVQFLPAFILPQILLCGLVTPRGDMSRVLQITSWAAPMTYAYGSLDHVARGEYGATLAGYAIAVAGFTLAALVLGATTLRRRTA